MPPSICRTEDAEVMCGQTSGASEADEAKKFLESGRAPAPTVADLPKLLWVSGVGKPRAESCIHMAARKRAGDDPTGNATPSLNDS